MDRYILSGYTNEPATAGIDWHLIEVEELADQALTEVMSAIHAVGVFDTHQSLYDICVRNYDDLLARWRDIEAQHQAEPATSTAYERRYNAQLEMNRRLMNYLSAFKTFVDHYETRFKRIDPEGTREYGAYTEITRLVFGRHFAYRFCSKLRNYVQHVGLPVGRIEFVGSVDPNFPGDRSRHVYTASIWFDRDVLLANYQEWGARVREDLQNQPEHLPILAICRELQYCIHLVNRVCLQIDLNAAIDSWQLLVTRSVQVQQQLPGAYPVIAQFEPSPGQALPYRLVGLTWFPLEEMKKIHELAACPP